MAASRRRHERVKCSSILRACDCDQSVKRENRVDISEAMRFRGSDSEVAILYLVGCDTETQNGCCRSLYHIASVAPSRVKSLLHAQASFSVFASRVEVRVP